MAVKVFTNAEMDYVTALGSNTPLATPMFDAIAAAWTSGMNGDTGAVAMSGNFNGQVFLPLSGLHDDGSVPPVITMTGVVIDLDYDITNGPMAPGDCTSVLDIFGNFSNQPEGHSTGHITESFAPATIFGGDQRSDMFISPSMFWAYGLDFTGVFGAHSVQCIVSNFTCTITYTTPVTPDVTSVTPNTGSVNGGQAVTVRGHGFTGSPGAIFGGTAVTSWVVVDDETATAVTPAHLSGLVDVEVLSVATGTGLYTYALDTVKLPPMPSRTPIEQG